MTFIQFLILPFIVFVDNNPTILILTCMNARTGNILILKNNSFYLPAKIQIF